MKASAQVITQYREYLSKSATSGEYDALVHHIVEQFYLEELNELLDDYGLAEQLAQAKAGRRKLWILEFGCGEGLYLHGLANLLEKRNLLVAAHLVGIDKAANLISTAEEYAKVSKPPRAELLFYHHDIREPLESLPILRNEGNNARFDLILSGTSMLTNMKNARQQLLRIYNDNLKPGGLICTREFINKEGPEGWISIHPALSPFTTALFKIFESYNPDLEAEIPVGSWLREAGAEQVREVPERLKLGGTTPLGKEGARSIILAVRQISPYLIQAGLMTQAEYDTIMDVIFKEFTPKLEGQQTYLRTMARKPL